MITFRPLTRADEDFLWDMVYEAIYIPKGQKRPPRAVIQQPEIACYVEGWGRPGDIGFAAMEGRIPIGAAWLRQLWPGEKGYGYVDDIYPELSVALRPGHRGKGIGTKLLRTLLAEARRKFPGVSLSVQSANPARRLYERLGFEVVDLQGDSLVMLLRWD